jgi:prevent-host-death family protein
MLISETIRPSADLRNHYNEVSKLCREENEVVIITVNGKGDTVSMAYEEYQRMKTKLEMLEILARSEEDVANGRVAPMRDTFDNIRKRLEEM